MNEATRRHILVVEDDKSAQTLLRLNLSGENEVELIDHDGKSIDVLVAEINEKVQDVLVLDGRLGSRKGAYTALDIIGRIRSGIQIIIYTGDDDVFNKAKDQKIPVIIKGAGPSEIARWIASLPPRNS